MDQTGPRPLLCWAPLGLDSLRNSQARPLLSLTLQVRHFSGLFLCPRYGSSAPSPFIFLLTLLSLGEKKKKRAQTTYSEGWET